MPLFWEWFNGDASRSGGFTRRRLIRNPVYFFRSVGSTGVNRARSRRVTIIKSSRGNGARRDETACISNFKMLTLASETSIYARTAEINCYYLMALSVLQFKRAESEQKCR